MPTDNVNHEEARRIAALQQPNHVLSGPYLDLTEKLEAAHQALREIGMIAAEPGDAMPALLEAQKIAGDALEKAGLESSRVLPIHWPPR